MSFDLEHRDEFYSLTLDDFPLQMSHVPLAVIKDYLGLVVAKHKRVLDILEYGSGVSTIWFSQTFPEARITSIEGSREWLGKTAKWIMNKDIKNVNLRFVEQTGNWRDPDEPVNPEYLNVPGGPYDLIINDGCIREKVAETLMLDMDTYLKPDGLYLRHDYDNLITGSWVGIGLSGNLDRKTYEEFCVDHPNYSVVTLNGNGKWGLWSEFGGLWRKN